MSPTVKKGPDLRLPRLRKVSLSHFTLFSANPNASFEFGGGVLCLVGANGIGKSTLLSAINFAITGVVPDPARDFTSMEEYYRHNKPFSAKYFRGRIAATEEQQAEILIEFSIDNTLFELRRGLFEPDELRWLRITDSSGDKPVIIEPDEAAQRGERHSLYANELVKRIGVASFEEFVFLQHFVFTFDEQRRTLFWSPRVMDRVLFRAFGVDAQMAKQADALRREIESEDSKVRNSQWEATRMRKRINDLRDRAAKNAGAKAQYEELVGAHKRLSEQFDQDSTELADADATTRDTSLRLAELSMKERALRQEYAQFFDARLRKQLPLAKHPIISNAVRDKACTLCGSIGKRVVEAIQSHAESGTCPLCDSELGDSDNRPEDLAKLRDIDRHLSKVVKEIANAHAALVGAQEAAVAARKAWDTTKHELDQFDRSNSLTLEALLGALADPNDDKSIEEYKRALAAMEEEKQAAYGKRTDLAKQLDALKKLLAVQYAEVESSFVPRYSELAYNFLGMPLNVQLDTTSQEVKLVVTVRGTTRRQQQQVSESQRFFLDIALRMALAQHMSAASSLGGMFIDTPEGSLDIAYEKRAGEMLAAHTATGHQIVMTANLNSSNLLLALARKCGRTGLRLCRMTDWAELSSVQQEEEGLFIEAYAKLEAALDA